MNSAGIAAMGALAVLAAVATAADRPTAADRGRLREVPFSAIRIEGGFWGPRIATVQDVTLPELLAVAGKQGKLDNFAIVAGRKKGRLALHNSPDSDVYKLMEAAAYSLASRPNETLRRRLDELVGLVAAAQAPDGYLNTQYMLPPGHPASPPADDRRVRRYGYGPAQQWQGRIADWPRGIGQLYCAGHLMESAVAHWRATGSRAFLNVAVRLAENLDRRFPPGRAIDYADHPQAGIGLVKLYEATGERRWLALADRIVHTGHHSRPVDLGAGESHKPLAEQRTAWGHAVRTGYLYAAATDLCRYLPRPGTYRALESLWRSLIDRRVYLIGGVGNGVPYEQHGPDWDLPNETCYCECCANIALAQWAHRLNLLTGRAAFADVVEIVAFNGALSGISLDGRKFFYANKLAAGRAGRSGPHSGVRKQYLFCCPAKVPTFLAGIGRWLYATDAAAIYVNLYAASTAEVRLPAGRVIVTQQTDYPFDGRIRLTLRPEKPAEFTLALRAPGWLAGRPLPSDLYRASEGAADEPSLAVNGRTVAARPGRDGYLRILRRWQPGDTVELCLPMRPRRIHAHRNVAADRGRVALMRGPVVYCLEGTDHPFDVRRFLLPPDAPLTAERRDDLLGGVTVLRGRGLADGKTPADFTAVPYYAWQNRDISEMAVWLVEDPAALPKTRPPSPSARPGDPAENPDG